MKGFFRKILIANRGEIVLRVMRSVRALGISATGIYSETDNNSGWVKHLSESWPLGKGSISDTYLNIEKIISIAKQSGSDAIHPGYGFLSENHLFAEACLDNNIVFIGPSPDVLKTFGNKTVSHSLVRKSGINVPQIYTGTISELFLLKDKLEYPVFVKAIAGGGGKGIRLVAEKNDLHSALTTTSYEAMQYFGNEKIFIEEYIPETRHVEVQILGDKFGKIIHLFERECSIQRRYQKIIEEAPANNISNKIKSEIYDAAISIAREVNFTNAGTVEFLLKKDGTFLFLEMNPRIQVEHGVTELVTGIDIVKEQISIAAGNPVSIDEHSVKLSGHAIEARICAEDPANNLLPSPGKVYYFLLPEMQNIRIETSASNDEVIHEEFDSLIVKILAWGKNRNEAISFLTKAIQNTVINGVKNSISLVDQILQDEDFLNNNISTRFIERKISSISSLLLKRKENLFPSFIICASVIIINKNDYSNNKSPWQSGYWRNNGQIRFRNKNEILELDYLQKGKSLVEIILNGITYSVSIINIGKYEVELNINDERRVFYPLRETNESIEISDGHISHCLELFTTTGNKDYVAEDDILEPAGDTILAPHPGTVLEIKVEEGQHVNKGDNLLTIESMKLENTILAGTQGLIKKITIKAGDKVKKNEPLMYLQQLINN